MTKSFHFQEYIQDIRKHISIKKNNTYIWIVIIVLLIIAPKWKEPKCSNDEWINKIGIFICLLMAYYLATKWPIHMPLMAYYLATKWEQYWRYNWTSTGLCSYICRIKEKSPSSISILKCKSPFKWITSVCHS